AQDVPAATATVLAATQRPLIFSSFVEPAPSAAWKTLPTWALVATDDRTLGDATAFMAERSGSTITRIEASHAVLVSHPDAVVEVINSAIAAIG
ncbi:MAG: alpha/beta fold hydrolase, partial [Thermomicrobiales bacterium]